MSWTPEQDACLKAVARWMKDPSQQVMRVFGYAGTGKTTLAKTFAEGVDGSVCFAAFTGKAAHVLRQKGCPGATTIHKLIYNPSSKSRQRLLELEREAAEARAQEEVDRALVRKLEEQIAEEKNNLARPAFKLNLESPLRGAKLLVLDECSMVDELVGVDLLSFGVKTLVLGDPAQLPPVYGAGYFTDKHPDVMLKEIHRQAEGNPIIALSKKVREGGRLEPGTYGDSRVMTLSDAKDQLRELVFGHDQMLVGRNRTRHAYNARVREIKGYPTVYPEPGDRLVCLRNNHELGLLNGSLWNVQRALLDPDDPEAIHITVKPEMGGAPVDSLAHAMQFEGQEPEWYERGTRDWFDYGYTLTVHKSQGSQWDRVLLFDEWRGDSYDRWLYTGITRAAESVTVVSM